MRRRRLANALIVTGVLALAYGACVYFWREPVTDLYAMYKQHQLAGQLAKVFAEYQPPSDSQPTPDSQASASSLDPPVAAADPSDETSLAVLEADTRRAAQRMLAGLKPDQVVGRIVIPKLGIHPIFVNGTSWGADLSRGPGRYQQTSLPGLGKVMAIAGHRTTFGAWFRHIDRMAAGDPIKIEMPYGTFTYTVVTHQIVSNDDWSVIRPRGYDELVLSACHPLYSASHRYIVFARLSEVETRSGISYAVRAPVPAGTLTPAAT